MYVYYVMSGLWDQATCPGWTHAPCGEPAGWTAGRDTHSEQDKYIMNVHDFTTSWIEVNAVNLFTTAWKNIPYNFM